MSARSAGPGDSGWEHIDAPDEATAAVVARWARLVRHVHRIRRLQRLWSHLGQHLQSLSPHIRDRARVVWPAASNPHRKH